MREEKLHRFSFPFIARFFVCAAFPCFFFLTSGSPLSVAIFLLNIGFTLCVCVSQRGGNDELLLVVAFF